MRSLKKEEISAIIFQLLSVFIIHDAWYDKAIFARGRVYATEDYFLFPELDCILEPIFAGHSGTVHVYRAENPYRDFFGRRQILSINLGSGDYLAGYSYSPYIDVLESLQAVVAPFGMYFEFEDAWLLNLCEV